MSRLCRTASILLALLTTAVPDAQNGSTAPAAENDRFEAVSVRRNRQDRGSFSAGFQRGGRFIAVAASPLVLVRTAFRYEEYRVFGAPAWASSEYYDIVAVANPAVFSQPTPDLRLQEMLRNLLAERFGLTVHIEKRPLATYSLVRVQQGDKLGQGLRRSTVDCKAFLASGRTAPEPRTADDFEKIPPCGANGGSGLLAAGGMTIPALADAMRGWLSAPVINRTGLDGAFDVHLKWNPDPLVAASDPSLPILQVAVQEQLGLKLERHTEPIDVLVIDRIRRPDEN